MPIGIPTANTTYASWGAMLTHSIAKYVPSQWCLCTDCSWEILYLFVLSNTQIWFWDMKKNFKKKICPEPSVLINVVLSIPLNETPTNCTTNRQFKHLPIIWQTKHVGVYTKGSVWFQIISGKGDRIKEKSGNNNGNVKNTTHLVLLLFDKDI